MAGALDGIRVLDLSRLLAGPYCAQALGDMGADVIKVEPPGHGDDIRTWGPPFLDGGESAYFMSTNRNKRGIVLDLKSDDGRAIVRRLIRDCDVLVENYRPGTLERWGLGYADLSGLNPGLVHVSVTGFGQTGRYRDRPGYDLIAQGMGGLQAITGTPDGPPVKAGLPVADLNAGTWAIIGTLMALFARQTTGRGQYVDVSLLEPQLALHVFNTLMYDKLGVVPGRVGSAHPMIAPYDAFEAADGWLNIAVGSQKLWHAFCGLLGLDIADDARFTTNAQRVTNRDDLDALVRPVLRTRTVAEWQAGLDAAGIPSGPINTLPDLYADPYLEERDMIVRMPHPTLGTYVGTGFPVHASGTPGEVRRVPPTLGQHTAEVLREFGYDDAEIDRLAAGGVLGEPPNGRD
ncbi:MAG TPA: CoA transferase [Streptosporangiaceae bacterium]|jgi:crotonobetainyl-CoA:carnitine CoA-transferase CaiB-like acyl-CoA transferase